MNKENQTKKKPLKSKILIIAVSLLIAGGLSFLSHDVRLQVCHLGGKYFSTNKLCFSVNPKIIDVSSYARRDGI